MHINKLGKLLDNLINTIYKFYDNQGHKRKTHLKKTCENLKGTFYELIYIFDIRWIASNFQGMKNVFNMWNILAVDFDEISKNTKDFDTNTTIKADALKQNITDNNMESSVWSGSSSEEGSESHSFQRKKSR